MTEDEKEQIVRDLINLTPRRSTKEGASEETESGYSHIELFNVGLHSKYSVDIYIYRLFYATSEKYQSWHTATSLKGQAAGVHKRRVNRVWERINPSVTKLWREGAPGIYSVSQGRFSGTTKLGHVYASNKAEAIELAKMCFGYLIPEDGDDYTKTSIHVHFISTEGPDEISTFNQMIEKDLVDRREHIENIVKNADEDLARIEISLNAMKIAENIMKKM